MQKTVQNTGPVPNLSRNNSPYLLLLNTALLPLEILTESVANYTSTSNSNI